MACGCLYVQAEALRARYHTQSSRDSPETVYASNATDVYSESPPRESPSPASMKRFKDQLEADIDALSSHSSDPDGPEIFDPEGKIPETISAWVAEFERGNRRQMAERRCIGLAGIIRACLPIMFMYSLLSCLQQSEIYGQALSLQHLPFFGRIGIYRQEQEDASENV